MRVAVLSVPAFIFDLWINERGLEVGTAGIDRLEGGMGCLIGTFGLMGGVEREIRDIPDPSVEG
jgi:hypothetical protein